MPGWYTPGRRHKERNRRETTPSCLSTSSLGVSDDFGNTQDKGEEKQLCRGPNKVSEWTEVAPSYGSEDREIKDVEKTEGWERRGKEQRDGD